MNSLEYRLPCAGREVIATIVEEEKVELFYSSITFWLSSICLCDMLWNAMPININVGQLDFLNLDYLYSTSC